MDANRKQQRNTKIDGVIEGRRLVDGLARDHRRLIRITQKPERSGQKLSARLR
jgi:hypothetical protein